MKFPKTRTATVILIVLLTGLSTGGPMSGLHAQTPDLEEGDIFVGAAARAVSAWENPSGAIYRVRNGVAVKFCESGAGVDYWNIPYEVLVDSQGRIVFLASLGSHFFSGQNVGFLRCNAMGQPPERLAIFQTGGAVQSGWPNPFPGQQVWTVKGLHLSRRRAVSIVDDENRGRPRMTTKEYYGLAFAPGNSGASGNPDAPYQAWKYDVDSREWKRGPRIVDTGRHTEFDMTYQGGNYYSISSNLFGRDSSGFTLDLDARIGDVVFGLEVNLLGGFRQLPQPIVVDDLTVPNPPSGNQCAGTMPWDYGGFRPLSGMQNVVFDTHGSFGLITTSDFGGNHKVSSNWQETLLNPDSSDDRGAYFQHPSFGCALAPFIGYLPVADVEGMLASRSGSLAAAPGGPVGIAYYSGALVRLRPGSEPVTIADASQLPSAGGVAAYPARVSTGSGVTLILRFDSPIDALVTMADGRRLGIDPATGEEINDFGSDGMIGPAGEPRFFAIRNPPAGAYDVRTIGTGDGPYTVHVYSVDLAKEEGEHIKTSGVATFGVSASHAFALETNGAIAGPGFSGGEPADTTPPVVRPVLSVAPNAAGWHNEPVVVSFVTTDDESAVTQLSGCDPVTLTAETAGTTLTCTATNAAGLVGSASAVIKIDVTAPSVACSASPAYLWPQRRELVPVTVTVGTADALSGGGAFVLTRATSTDGDVPGDIQDFVAGTPDVAGLLRSDRRHGERGRTYLLTYEALDLAGNAGRCVAAVAVTRQKSR